jgi:two-component system chemotaxis response regulator CheB
MKQAVKVLVVDDSVVMRQRLTSILSADQGIEVIGVARDGKEAVQKAVQLRPDVITMDIHMPQMDGLTALQYIRELAPCPVIIFSTLSEKGALITLEALELGAFDFVAKTDVRLNAAIDVVETELIHKIMAAAESDSHHHKVRQMKQSGKAKEPSFTPADDGYTISKVSSGFDKIAVIGVSTGGPRTIMDILPHLPQNLPIPILLVQHMPPFYTSSFAERLNRNLALKVVEGQHRMVLEGGTVYVAPGGQHMCVEKVLGKRQYRLAIRSQPAETLFKPSVNITMLSVLEQFSAAQIIGILLTGIGDDGAEGMVQIRKSGGVTIAESAETSVVYGMPKAAIERGGAQYVLPAYEIARTLLKEVYG